MVLEYHHRLMPLRPNATSSVKIHFRTKIMLLLCNQTIAHIILAFSMIIKKLVKCKMSSDIRHNIPPGMPRCLLSYTIDQA